MDPVQILIFNLGFVSHRTLGMNSCDIKPCDSCRSKPSELTEERVIVVQCLVVTQSHPRL